MLNLLIKKLQSRKHKRTLWGLVPQLLEKYRPDCVLDVGANRGQFAQKLRRAGFRGRIISFEPNPEIFQKLVEASCGDPLWSAEQLALGDQPGTLELNITNTSEFSSFLKPNEFSTKAFQQHSAITKKVLVQTKTVDDYLRELPSTMQPDRLFLKMDTQGFDKQVLLGSQTTLEKAAILLTELSFKQIYEGMPNHIDMLVEIQSLGFELAGLYPVSRERRSLALIEADGIFVKQSMSIATSP